MYYACIFDLDGTLTNTLESITISVNLTLREMGLTELTSEQCRRFIGDGARCLMERALEAAGDLEISGNLRIAEAMERYGRIFDAYCTYHVEPYEGIREMLHALRTHGIKAAVLSNKPHSQAVQVVESIFGAGLFDHIQGQCDSIPKKPNPEGVFTLLELMEMKKEECLYIGDSDVDMKTGQNAGVQTIGVSWGFRTKEILLKAGGRDIIERPEELLDYIHGGK